MRFCVAVCAAVLRGEHDFIIVGHVNLLLLVAACLLLRRRSGRRVVLVAHGIEVWTQLGSRRTEYAMSKLDLILSVSHYTRDRIRAQRPEIAEERFTIFPNALSETWLQRFAPSHPADLSGGLPRPFLLSVTRFDRGDRYKGLTTVIETLAMLEDTSVHYIVAGRGDDKALLEGLVHRLGLVDRVHFVGAVSDAQLARLYAQCAAFVLPSGKEGFGIVFLEAMYFGAPVIAAREKGALDVVRDEQTGLLVPYGDTIALGAAIMRLLRDEALCVRLRENGRRTVGVDGEFSFRAYVARLGNLMQVPLPQLSASCADGEDDLAQRRRAQVY
jgi:glycosyltransferase involved in cell wall biosynthesis